MFYFSTSRTALPLTCPFLIPGLPVTLFHVVNTQITHFHAMFDHYQKTGMCQGTQWCHSLFRNNHLDLCLACWHWKCICSEWSSSACPSVTILMHCLCLKNALLLPCHQPLICCLCSVEHTFFARWDFNIAVTLTSSQRLHFAMCLFDPCFSCLVVAYICLFNISKTFKLFLQSISILPSCLSSLFHLSYKYLVTLETSPKLQSIPSPFSILK